MKIINKTNQKQYDILSVQSNDIKNLTHQDIETIYNQIKTDLNIVVAPIGLPSQWVQQHSIAVLCKLTDKNGRQETAIGEQSQSSKISEFPVSDAYDKAFDNVLKKYLKSEFGIVAEEPQTLDLPNEDILSTLYMAQESYPAYTCSEDYCSETEVTKPICEPVSTPIPTPEPVPVFVSAPTLVSNSFPTQDQAINFAAMPTMPILEPETTQNNITEFGFAAIPTVPMTEPETTQNDVTETSNPVQMAVTEQLQNQDFFDETQIGVGNPALTVLNFGPHPGLSIGKSSIEDLKWYIEHITPSSSYYPIVNDIKSFFKILGIEE